MTEEKTTLKGAVETRGPLAVWDLMTEDEKKLAAAALWANADRDSRAVIELALANEMKFRPQSVRKLSAERVTGRLTRLASELPDTAHFQFLFHLHMAERRPLMTEFLDALELPHNDGVLDLPDDAKPPTAEAADRAARELIGTHGHDALVYLATLAVADDSFWHGILPVLDEFDEAGEAVG